MSASVKVSSIMATPAYRPSPRRWRRPSPSCRYRGSWPARTRRAQTEAFLEGHEVVDAGVGGVYDRSAANGKRWAGPNTWQWASQAFGGGVRAGGGCGSGCGGGMVRSVTGTPGEDDSVHQLAGGADDARPFDHRAAIGAGGEVDGGLEGAGRVLEQHAALAAPPAATRTSWAGEPGRRAAVATDTAPSTPMASWHLCGMKVRVHRTPPAARRRDEGQLRHREAFDVTELHQGPGRPAHGLEPGAQGCVGLQVGARPRGR